MHIWLLLIPLIFLFGAFLIGVLIVSTKDNSDSELEIECSVSKNKYFKIKRKKNPSDVDLAEDSEE
ncbi:hypothetical protein EZV73_22335 [Acidaminobacter sp. JC074]|uniref:hypothetical protein n=1 Tax=Acidaminobacter sp. JC074 TaxID=2530199 RepID=UPI001F0E2F84|nr:hypothetical protein [Acidaminobacter sp. JC074]MCH4890338.1 hypothetical protein [Acidaminobacter sp. JC074]